MATQRCWKCHRQFQVPDDEIGDHGCPNPLCSNYDLLDIDDGGEEDEL
jgi:hypothetical protein